MENSLCQNLFFVVSLESTVVMWRIHGRTTFTKHFLAIIGAGPFRMIRMSVIRLLHSSTFFQNRFGLPYWRLGNKILCSLFDFYIIQTVFSCLRTALHAKMHTMYKTSMCVHFHIFVQTEHVCMFFVFLCPCGFSVMWLVEYPWPWAWAMCSMLVFILGNWYITVCLFSIHVSSISFTVHFICLGIMTTIICELFQTPGLISNDCGHHTYWFQSSCLTISWKFYAFKSSITQISFFGKSKSTPGVCNRIQNDPNHCTIEFRSWKLDISHLFYHFHTF